MVLKVDGFPNKYQSTSRSNMSSVLVVRKDLDRRVNFGDDPI